MNIPLPHHITSFFSDLGPTSHRVQKVGTRVLTVILFTVHARTQWIRFPSSSDALGERTRTALGKVEAWCLEMSPRPSVSPTKIELFSRRRIGTDQVGKMRLVGISM